MRLIGSLLLLGTLLFSGEAAAQEMYDTSVPAERQVLDKVPDPMVINFLEGILVQKVEIVGADGKRWPVAWTPTEDDVSKVEFCPVDPLPPGSYEVWWWAFVRQHYHPDGGVIPFTIAPKSADGGSAPITQAATAPAAGAPPPAPDLRDPTPRAGAAPRPGR